MPVQTGRLLYFLLYGFRWSISIDAAWPGGLNPLYLGPAGRRAQAV
jgi:hypothetical protein